MYEPIRGIFANLLELFLILVLRKISLLSLLFQLATIV
jgi:hypothetical protein